MKKYAAFLILLFSLSVAAQEPASDALYTQAKKHLIALLGIDTSQPTPDETAAARYIYKELNKHHIDWEFLSPHKGNANILARIKGSDPKAKPLLLISHLDTVSAADDWTFPPYRATLLDGKIYGLGATDAKNYTAMHLALFTWIKDSGRTPRRDVIFLATSGEEAGSHTGLKWLAENHWDKIQAGYALNEGGGVIKQAIGNKPLVFAEASSKMYMDLKLTAAGEAQHSSMPVEDNAVYHLSQALAKLPQFNPPARLTSTTRTFFQRLAPLQDEDAQTTIQLLLSGTSSEQQMAADIISQDPFFRSQLKDTLTPVHISSGADTNASSAEASALLNARLLPDTDPDEFVKELTHFLGHKEVFNIETIERPQLPFPTAMDGSDELFASISRAAQIQWPGAVTVPGLNPASGDSETLRRLGVITYGLGPAMNEQSDEAAAHTSDEFITEEEYQEQVSFFAKVLEDFLFGPTVQTPATNPPPVQ